MSARSRTSGRGPGMAAHEESQIWAETFNLLKQIPEMHARAQKIAVDANKLQKTVNGTPAVEDVSPDVMLKLQDLYMTGCKVAETEAGILEKAREQLDVLAALRNATELYSDQKRKRKDPPTDPQPPKTKKVKTDEIKVGSQVAFHLPKAKQSDAEWIQCNVIRITGDFHKLRYEVQDPEPDEHGNMSQTYKTNAQSIILIPDDSIGLPALPSGTMVLARYPETTTFYKAEVIATKRDGTCKLRFEGEEEIGKETDVERRLVLEYNN